MTQTISLSTRSVVAAVAGNVLEFYDFLTYTFFAVAIGNQFFPTHDKLISLMLSVGTFGVGFFSRPIGGLVIGAYADRAGRKKAMMLTISLMATGMLAIAATPSYATIGFAAPVLIVAARLVQGFALGGEVGPATSFLVEAAPPGRRGFYASWQIASQGIATLMAGAIGLGLTFLLSPAAMNGWGWRIPFLLGVLIIPVAIFMRRHLPETAQIDLSDNPHHDVSAIVTNLATRYRKKLALSFLLISAGTIGAYVMNYMTIYAQISLHMPERISIAATLVLGVCTTVFAVAGGALSDRIGRRMLVVVPRLVLTVAAYPCFLLLQAWPNGGTLLLVTGFLGSLNAVANGVSLAVIPENFPRRIRSAGLAVTYALGVTIFGGTTQLVITSLIHYTGNQLSPAWYLAVASAVGLLAGFAMPETGAAALLD